MVKNLPANAGDIRDTGTIPGSGRSPRGGNGNPLQYSCLENCINRERSLAGYSPCGCKESDTKEATYHACTKIWTQPNFSSMDEQIKICIYACVYIYIYPPTHTHYICIYIYMYTLYIYVFVCVYI